LEHIKGHQDWDGSDLSYEAKLNVKEDKLASQALMLKSCKDHSIPSQHARMFIQGKAVTSNHSRNLKEAFHTIILRSYFRKKYRWDEGLIDPWKSNQSLCNQ
jgi:hypothetical protein